MRLNPYVEILAKALYRKEMTPIYVYENELEDAKDAVSFINCRNYVARFELKGSWITMELVEDND